MADVQRALRSWWVVGGTAEASVSDGEPGIYPLTNPVAGFSYQYTLVGSKSDLFCMKMTKNHIQPMTNQNLSLVPDPSLLPTHCAKMQQQVLLLLTKRSPRVKWPRPPSLQTSAINPDCCCSWTLYHHVAQLTKSPPKKLCFEEVLYFKPQFLFLFSNGEAWKMHNMGSEG